MTVKRSPTVPDSRRWWKNLAQYRQGIIDAIRADYDLVEAELKQLVAERESCTCKNNNRPTQDRTVTMTASTYDHAASGFLDAAALLTAHANDDRPGLARMIARMNRDELEAAIVGLLGCIEVAGRHTDEDTDTDG